MVGFDAAGGVGGVDVEGVEVRADLFYGFEALLVDTVGALVLRTWGVESENSGAVVNLG